MTRKPRTAKLGSAEIRQEDLRRFQRVRPILKEAMDAIARGRRPQTESRERLAKAALREAEMQQIETLAELAQRSRPHLAFAERIIGSDDILLIGFLARGVLAARSVVRLSVAGGALRGTGFLVGPDALITNNHVLAGQRAAKAASVEFEFHDQSGIIREMRSCGLDPDRFWFTHEELDITVCALDGSDETQRCTRGLGWHPMNGREGKITIGDPVNIIQHPGGGEKSVVVHNSNLLHLENGSDLAPFFWYSSDTQKGSSGAPVFNNRWEVIGVHHRSVPATNEKGEVLDRDGNALAAEDFERRPDKAAWVANQGVRTSHVVRALREAAFANAAHGRFRDELLARWEMSSLRNFGQAEAAAIEVGTNQAADVVVATQDAGRHEGGTSRHGQPATRITITIEPRG